MVPPPDRIISEVNHRWWWRKRRADAGHRRHVPSGRGKFHNFILGSLTDYEYPLVDLALDNDDLDEIEESNTAVSWRMFVSPKNGNDKYDIHDPEMVIHPQMQLFNAHDKIRSIRSVSLPPIVETFYCAHPHVLQIYNAYRGERISRIVDTKDWVKAR